MHRRRAFFALACLAVASAACSAILGLEPPPDGTEVPGSEGGAPGPEGGNGCPIHYVSATTGDDANDGCTTAAAKKTIKSAVGLVESEGAPGYVIKVCAGIYPEISLKVNLGGQLLGGYSCHTWARTPAYRTDGVNETLVTVASPDTNNFVAFVMGAHPADAGASPLLVDGFTFQGPSKAGLSNSTAVQLLTGSTGTLANCKILSGDATSLSIGIDVLGPATPEIKGNTIKSGAALQTMGVHASTAMNAGAPHIHDNTITGGTVPLGATANAGSFGINLAGPLELTLAKGSAIENNVIVAGQGTPSVGIDLVRVGAADVVHNHIESGPSPPGAAATPNGLHGLAAYDSSNVHVLGNRLYGGGLPNGVGNFEGVTIVRGPGAVVANNMIYGGFRQSTVKEDGSSTGVNLAGCTAPIVENNTIFGGFSASVLEISLNTQTTGAIVRNNILVGNGLNDAAMRVDECTKELATLQNNLFVATNTSTLRAICPDAGGTAADISQLKAPLVGAEVSGNLTMRAQCSLADTDSGACILTPACEKDAGIDCFTDVFAAWSAIDNGYGTLFSTGWMLADAVPCLVAQGALDLSSPAEGPALTTDLYGNARTATPSMGAAQGARCK